MYSMAKTNKKGYISVSKSDNTQVTKFAEKFNSEVTNDEITFPKALGVKHPFNFEDAEKTYKKTGFVYGAVKKYVHSIIGEFSVKTKDENATIIIKNFIKNSNFRQVIGDWLTEGFVKGNGFLEVDLKEQKLRVVNANNMYVVRDKSGNVLGYNQYIGDSKTYSANKVNPFKPNQIVHLKINQIPDEAYGIGILWPNERVIENICLKEEDWQKLLARKAGAPIHFKIGQPGEAVNPGVIDQIKADLQYMTNKTEWVTDGNVDIKTVDFGEIGKNLADALNHDLLMFSYGTMIPESMLGKGNMAEGLAKTDQEGWHQLISAYQDQLESLIEENLFKPILLANKFDVDVDFVWNLPTDSQINDRMLKLTTLLQNQTLDENIRRYANIEIAKLMGWDGAEKLLTAPSPTANEERKKEDALKQPEVPGAKPMAGQSLKESLINESDLSLSEFANIKEVAGLNYSDYLVKVLEVTTIDKFENLLATDSHQITLGLLSEQDIEKLRTILKTGFKESQTIKQIENNIKSEINLKDRIDEEGNILSAADSRPNMIARTEVVRLSNEGLKSLYKDNGVQEVRWLSALSDRTCPQCDSMNGQVFKINEMNFSTQPPLHPNCRCTLLSVI